MQGFNWRTPRSSLLLAFLFLTSTFSGVVSASDDWIEDGWLNNEWTEMRIENGDEFGCHGMPNMDLSKETYETAIACRNYLEGLTEASRWSENVVSIGVDEEISYTKHALLEKAGFTVHGVDTGLENSSWHNSEDVPTSNDSWWNIGQTGSIESGATELSVVKDLAAEGGLVNLYWEARIADLKLRTNSELINWLESNNSWLTTWGEAWSYWNYRDESFLVNQHEQNSWLITFNSSITAPVWEIPITRGFVVGETIIQSVKINDSELSETGDDNRKLRTGWRQEGQLLYVTMSHGSVAIVEFEDYVLANTSSPCHNNHISNLSDCESIERPTWYNNLSWALTITGHHTTNLFDWSNKFDESPLVFTWLVIPLPKEEYSLILPVVGIVVAVATTFYARKIIQEDRINRQETHSEE